MRQHRLISEVRIIKRKGDWTDEQIEILKEEYAKHTPICIISELTGKSENGVKMKASRLGITKPCPKESKPHRDLTGQVFGRLTAIRPLGKNKYNHMMWECKCSCGNPNPYVTSEYYLMSGHSISCGCYSVDFCKEHFKKYNTYDLSGDYGKGYTDKGEEFLFDLEDYNLIKDYCWRVNSYGYIQTVDSSGTIIMMHRLVMGISGDEEYKDIDIDHIHREAVYDNRKINLRLATRTQNNMNRTLQSNNTSGVTGVYYDKRKGDWVAQIGLNKEHIYLGSYSDFDDAVAVRKAAEEQYFGERSYDNSQATVID